jgi:hypothetical protein
MGRRYLEMRELRDHGLGTGSEGGGAPGPVAVAWTWRKLQKRRDLISRCSHVLRTPLVKSSRKTAKNSSQYHRGFIANSSLLIRVCRSTRRD